jgi:hypothetical protein
MAAPIGSVGASTSWQSHKANVLRVWDIFNRKPGSLPTPFNELAESELCNSEIFEAFANYLMSDYVIGAGVRHAGQRLTRASVVVALRRTGYVA